MSDWKMFKENLSLRLFALTRIPLIATVRPRLVVADGERCVVRIPLRYKTKNHLGSLYFGALCIGADLAAGLIVMNMIRARRSRVAFLFKDFHADFLKRAEGTTEFTCRDGAKLTALLDQAESCEDRLEGTVEVVATVPEKLGDDPVATFKLTISMKRR